MAFPAVVGPPMIAWQGSGEFLNNVYQANAGGGDWSAGDFLRITSDTGECEITDVADSDDTGGIALYALKDYDASEDGDGIFVPVFRIAEDTVFCQQIASGTPAQSDVGGIRTLDLTSGKMAPTATASKGVVTVYDIALNKKWMYSSEDICGEYGLIYFKINASIINAARTAAT